jgi:hypothetical protein
LAAYDYKIEVFIPESHTAPLMQALSAAGVGRIGNYDYCFAITEVQGHWRPLEGASPFEGEIGVISRAPEHKLELSCPSDQVRAALVAIQRVHPYEQPVVNVIALSNASFQGGEGAL